MLKSQNRRKNLNSSRDFVRKKAMLGTGFAAQLEANKIRVNDVRFLQAVPESRVESGEVRESLDALHSMLTGDVNR